MKILLSSTSSKYSNGASRCLVELAEGLSKNGYEVVVTLPRAGEMIDVLKKNNIRYYIVRETHYAWYINGEESKSWIKMFLSKLFNNIAVVKACNIIKKENIDIVHINAVTAYAVAIAGYKCRLPVIWHIREFLEDDLNMKFVSNKFAYRIINKGRKAVAISNSIYNKYKEELKIPIEVINDGLPIENYYVNRKKNGSDVINVVLYGRITPGKGQLFYVKGIKKALPLIGRKCHFYYAGTVENQKYFSNVEKEIRDSGLSDKISYLGEIKDVKAMLSSMHISCVCSKREGFGRVTVESMLGNCLVVGANTGATAEIITDKINGILYKENDVDDFSNRLAFAINNYENYEEVMGKAQKEAIEKYSLNADIQKVMHMYAELCVKE